MYADSFGKQIQVAARRRAWPVFRTAICLLVLSLAMLTVGVVVALTSDPDWNGTTPENISESILDRAWQPSLAVGSSGQAVVVWSEERADGRNIYSANNGGGEWSVPQAISVSAKSSRYPNLLAIEDQYFVAWIDVDDDYLPTYAVFETEIGEGEVRTIVSPEALLDMRPHLAASTDRLHLVFCADDLNLPNIYYTSRLLAETDWPAAEQAYTSTAMLGSKWPALAVSPDGGTVHLVWEDDAFSSQSIEYMSGTVSGGDVSWSPAIELSTGIPHAIRPDIAVDSEGDIHIVWGEEVGIQNSEKYVRYTRYASGSWSTPIRVDPNPVTINVNTPGVIAPRLALRETGSQVEICVAWAGYRTGGDAEEVLLRCAVEGGDWSSASTENVSRSKQTREVSISPAIASSGSELLHVVWQECTGGSISEDYEIHHAADTHQVFLPLVTRNY